MNFPARKRRSIEKLGFLLPSPRRSEKFERRFPPFRTFQERPDEASFTVKHERCLSPPASPAPPAPPALSRKRGWGRCQKRLVELALILRNRNFCL